MSGTLGSGTFGSGTFGAASASSSPPSSSSLYYGGSLAFSLTDQGDYTVPACVIPLYIKSYAVPSRKPKFSEVATSRMIDAGSFSISAQYVFESQPEPLQTALSGFFITPTALHNGKRLWNPTIDGSSTGTSLGLLGMSYAEIIMAYTEGRATVNSAGYGTRINPSYFVDPYGTTYNTVRIVSFESTFTPTYKRQTFTMTLALEP